MSDAGDIKLGLEAVKSLVGKFLQAATGFIGVLIFTRLVGKSDFGGFYLLLTLVMLWQRPLGGFYSAVEKRWSERDSPKRMLFGSVLLINTLGIILTVGVVLANRDLLVSYVGLEGAPLLFILLTGSFLFFSSLQSVLSAEGWPSKRIWVDTVRSLATLPLQVWLVFAGLGALGMGYGLVGATLFVIPLSVYFVWTQPAIPDESTLQSLWEYARYSSVESIVGKAYDRIDILLLGFLAGAASVANYEVALKLTVPARFVAVVIGTSLRPKISNTASKGNAFETDVTNAAGYVSILALPIFFGALALPKPLVVTAFDQEYASAAPYLVGLAFYQVLAGQSQVYRQTLAGMDLPNITLKASSITLAFNIIVGVGLLTVLGPIGIVIATILAEALQYLLLMHQVTNRVDGISIISRPLVKQVLAGGLMYLVVEFTEKQVAIHSWLDLGILIALGGVTYGATLVVISPRVRFTARSIYQDAIA